MAGIERIADRVRVDTTVRELVEWTYAAQMAHRGGAPNGGGGGISQTGLVVERLLLGCAVDTSPGGAAHWGGMYCDEDALTVHGLVECMTGGARGLLITHGAARSVPDWSPLITPLRCVPVPGRKGQVRGIYAHKGKTLIGCEVSYEGDIATRADAQSAREHCIDVPDWRWDVEHGWSEWRPLRCAEDVMEFAHMVYVNWYMALETLQDMLLDYRLRRWRIKGLGAVCAPWLAKS